MRSFQERDGLPAAVGCASAQASPIIGMIAASATPAAIPMTVAQVALTIIRPSGARDLLSSLGTSALRRSLIHRSSLAVIRSNGIQSAHLDFPLISRYLL